MNKLTFHDYDVLIFFAIAFLVLIGLARIIGDRQIPPFNSYTVNVSYDKDTPEEEIHRRYQEAHKIIRKDCEAKNINIDSIMRHMGIDGFDIVWGNEPEANHVANSHLRFAVIWIPLLFATLFILILARLRASRPSPRLPLT